jgi:hypothetical protein
MPHTTNTELQVPNCEAARLMQIRNPVVTPRIGMIDKTPISSPSASPDDSPAKDSVMP